MCTYTVKRSTICIFTHLVYLFSLFMKSRFFDHHHICSASVQSPKPGSLIHAAVTTTMCPAPSSTHARSSFCPTLRTRASVCGTCPRGQGCRPSDVTMIASGCWELILTSICLQPVSNGTGLYTFYISLKPAANSNVTFLMEKYKKNSALNGGLFCAL